MKNIPIAEATPDQVRNFAQMVGVDILPNDGPETIFAKLKLVWNSDLISVADDVNIGGALGGQMRVAPETREPGQSSEFSTAARAERLVGSYGRDDPRVVLTVQKMRVGNDVSNSDVPVGVNGVAFQLKTGVPVDVPYRVYEALNNARRMEVTHDDHGDVIESEVHAYPFNVLEAPSRAEVAAWKEKTAGLEMA